MTFGQLVWFAPPVLAGATAILCWTVASLSKRSDRWLLGALGTFGGFALSVALSSLVEAGVLIDLDAYAIFAPANAFLSLVASIVFLLVQSNWRQPPVSILASAAAAAVPVILYQVIVLALACSLYNDCL